jgi:hypothetical protein
MGGQMSGIPAARSPKPEKSPSAPSGGKSPPPTADNRSRHKKIVTPLVLAILGLLLLLSARLVYPPTVTQNPDTSLFSLSIDTSEPVTSIECSVSQFSSAITEVLITVISADVFPPHGSSQVAISLYPQLSGFSGRGLSKTATFHTLLFKTIHFAQTPFIFKARSFGLTHNALTASAAIPYVIFRGPGTPEFGIDYDSFPGASSYDWSSFPATSVSNLEVSWDVALTEFGGAGAGVATTPTQGQIVIGINHTAQVNDDRRTFYAGALLGLAGGALLSAVQEVLSRFVG